jgi:hypothetical protein
MFPNLRELDLRYFDGGNPQKDYISNKFHFIYPTSKLERIADIGECELTCQLAASNLCNRLKSLELDFSDSPGSMSNIVIPRLKNMPVLENLYITNTKIKLAELEIIHSNLPLLKTLELKEIDIIDDDLPRDIKPATSIASLNLRIEKTPELHTHIQFYQYMAKKYPSVTTFLHHDHVMNNQSPDYLIQLYKRGIFPFLQNIKTHRNNYYFDNYCNGLDAFKKFDEFGWRLKYLYIKSFIDDTIFLEELAQSEQSKYIEELALEEILPEPMNMLINMEALTTLSIDYNFSYMNHNVEEKQIIHFNQLLEACPPTLSTLSISGVDFVLTESTTRLTSIKHLKLTLVDLTPELARFIETSFPHLSTLYLHCNISNNVTISLPNHNLEIVCILIEYDQHWSNNFSLRTTCDDKLEYYAPRATQNDTATSYFPTITRCVPVTRERLTEPFMFDFICASVKESSFSVREKKRAIEPIM